MALRPPACTQLMRSAFYSNPFTEHTKPGVTLEQVMTDDYWVHVWKQLKANDVITVISADGWYDVDLRITSVMPKGPNDIPRFTFRLIREWYSAQQAAQELPPIPATPRGSNDRYEVKRGFGGGKWRVIDQMTGNVVCDGVTKDVAEAEKLKLDTPVAA